MKTAAATAPSVKRALDRLSSRRAESADVRIGKILAPIDFSPSSQQALDCADSLAKHFGAELHLVHVFKPHHPFIDSTVLPLVLPRREVVSRIRRDLKKLAGDQRLTIAGLNIHAVAGSPFEGICELARQEKTDLIVIPTHGNTGLKHLVLGSTAERVVQHAPCPVLVIRSTQTEEPRTRATEVRPPAFSKILVPVDFSQCSLDGLSYARKLAAHFGSQLVLLHTVHLQTYVSTDEYGRYDLPMVASGAEGLAKDQMRELAQTTDWGGVKFETTVEVGHAGQQICDRAADRGVDLIVTSTHGYTGLKHVFLGSTAEYVVRHATCPVLVVPSHIRSIATNGSSK